MSERYAKINSKIAKYIDTGEVDVIGFARYQLDKEIVPGQENKQLGGDKKLTIPYKRRNNSVAP